MQSWATQTGRTGTEVFLRISRPLKREIPCTLDESGRMNQGVWDGAAPKHPSGQALNA